MSARYLGDRDLLARYQREQMREVDRRTDGWHPSAVAVIVALAGAALDGRRTREVLASFGRPAGSMMSRYQRAGLCSPRLQLIWLRLALAHRLGAEGGWNNARVGLALGWSSPQAFGRTVRGMTGLHPPEWFRRAPAQVEARVARVIRWADPRWRELDPINGAHQAVAPFSVVVRTVGGYRIGAWPVQADTARAAAEQAAAELAGGEPEPVDIRVQVFREPDGPEVHCARFRLDGSAGAVMQVT